MTLNASITALGPGLRSSFAGAGGTEPYFYSVLPGGAGGSIDASSGWYTAPAVLSQDPKQAYDTIQAQDYIGAIATKKILVGNHLLLFCDIIQKEMGLSDGRVYLWDQKIMQPTDSALYIAVGIASSKPFANTNRQDSSGSGLDAVQSINMLDLVTIDLISRGPEARDRKPEVLLALGSNYAQSQQELNSFRIGQLPSAGQFVNLSEVDGAAIPYRFRISVNMQYFYVKTKAVDYLDSFAQPTVVTEP